MVIVVGNSKRKNPYRRTLPFISLRERERKRGGGVGRASLLAVCRSQGQVSEYLKRMLRKFKTFKSKLPYSINVGTSLYCPKLPEGLKHNVPEYQEDTLYI